VQIHITMKISRSRVLSTKIYYRLQPLMQASILYNIVFENKYNSIGLNRKQKKKHKSSDKKLYDDILYTHNLYKRYKILQYDTRVSASDNITSACIITIFYLPSAISLGSLSRSLNWRLRLLKKFTTLSTTSVSRLAVSSSPADLAEDKSRATSGSLTSWTPSNNSISGCSLIRSRAVNSLCLIHGPNCGQTQWRS